MEKEKTVEEKKKIELKKLKGKHFFIISNIARKLNLDVKKIMNTFFELQKKGQEAAKKAKNVKKIDEELAKNNSETIEDFLNMIVKEVFEKLYLVEEEITNLLVDLTELSKKELEEIDFTEYAGLVKRLISDTGFIKMLN